MHDITEDLLELNQHFSHRLENISKPFLDAFSANQICVDMTYSDGQYWALNTNQCLWQYYLSNEGLQQDPTVINPELLGDNVFVWSACKKSDYNEMLNGFENLFDLKQGVSIARLLSSGNNFGVSFGTRSNDPSFIPRLLKEIPLIEQFIVYVQDELSDIQDELYKNSISLEKYKKGGYYNDSYLYELEVERRQELLQYMGVLKKEEQWLANVTLTQRQAQCASLYLSGLSVLDIAKALGISYDSTKQHFDLIKKKVRVKNKHQLIGQLKVLKKLKILDCAFINLENKKDAA